MSVRVSGAVTLPVFLQRAQGRSLRLHRLLLLASREAPPTPQLLHELHRELRRARLDARVLRRSLPKEERPPFRELEKALGRLARLAGEARDDDVLLASLAQLVKGAPPEVLHEARTLERVLDREAASRRRRLRQEARARLRDASERLPGPSPGSRGPAAQRRFEAIVREELEDARADLLRSRRRARRRPSVRRLHRLRISVRRLRHLRTSIAREPSRADLDNDWQRLQRDLGAHHDLGVLEGLIRTFPRTSGRRALQRLLHQKLERRKERARRRLKAGVTAPHPPLTPPPQRSGRSQAI